MKYKHSSYAASYRILWRKLQNNKDLLIILDGPFLSTKVSQAPGAVSIHFVVIIHSDRKDEKILIRYTYKYNWSDLGV